MAKYDLKLKTTDAGTGKARTLTLTNVNPEASANTLKQFTQQLNQLTTNTYVETDYIVTTNLDTETPPIDTRQTPTLSIPTVPTLAQVKNNSGNWIQRSYNGDGVVYLRRNTGCNAVAFVCFDDSILLFRKESTSADQVTGGTFILGATGTDNYKPIEVEYTLE